MAVDLSFDIETLGLHENAIVLSMSCVPFEMDAEDTAESLRAVSFYCKFDVREQKKLGRDMDRSTLQFWQKQSADAIRLVVSPSKSDVDLKTGLLRFSDFIRASGYDRKNSICWSRGNYFDFPKIESLHRLVGLELPFNNWKIRDFRTAIDVITGSNNGQYRLSKPFDMMKHHCLDDAIYDALVMQELSRILREGNES